MSRPLAVVVLAAGQGKRTKVSVAKVLLPICGRTLVDCVLDAAAELEPDRTVVVVGHHKERVQQALSGRKGLTFADQGEPRGTGHAVQTALAQLQGFDGDVLVLYGDTPLLTADTLRELRKARGEAPCALLTAWPADPTGLGRILRDDRGRLRGIREERDCTPEEQEIDEVNAGVYCFAGAAVGPALARIGTKNAQGELYLTDAVGVIVQDGAEVATVSLEDPDEVLGVNSLTDLALARMAMQERILLRHLDAGVVIQDPATTYIDHDVQIGAETRILPCTVIGNGCRIGRNCEIGPFAHLRAGTVLEDGAEIGNFVEAKKTVVGAGTKAKHLTYLGDAVIGKNVNIGAGTITANFDGKLKHETRIGDRAFVGSGTVLVAPSTMAADSATGAGAVVKRNSSVGSGEVWVGVPARPLARPAAGRKERP